MIIDYTDIEGTIDSVPKYRISNRPDRVAQLAEHWASIPKVVGSIPTVARHILQACPVWIHTQSNITSILYTCNYIGYIYIHVIVAQLARELHQNRRFDSCQRACS